MRLSSKSPSAWRSNSSPPSSTMSNTGSACGIHFISRCFHSFQPSFGCFRYAESWGSWFRRQPLQLSMRPRVDPTWGAESESGGWGEPRTSERARRVQARAVLSAHHTAARATHLCAGGKYLAATLLLATTVVHRLCVAASVERRSARSSNRAAQQQMLHTHGNELLPCLF